MKKTFKCKDGLFWISYGIFLFFGILSTSFYYVYFIGAPYKIIKYFCVGLLLIREIFAEKYNIKSLILGMVFIALIIITRSQASVATVVYILIFVFCARNIDFKDIAKFSIRISLFAVVIVIASAYAGIIQNYDYSTADRVRMCLGFRYPLYAPVFFFNVTGLILYVKNRSIKWIEFCLLILVNLWLFSQTNSRLSFGCTTLMIFMFVILKVSPDFYDKKRILSWLMIWSFILGFIISMYFTVAYNPDMGWQNQLNSVLGGRLQLGQESLSQYGVTLFGQEMEFVGNGLDVYGKVETGEYNYVDSFYVQVLQQYGIIFSMLWIGLLTFTIYRFYKLKDYAMMICLSIIALHCIVDDLSLSLYYNTFWFATTVVIAKYHIKHGSKKFNVKYPELNSM